MFKITIAYILISLSIGCAPTIKPVFLKDGKEGHAINCGGSTCPNCSWDDCYALAGQACGQTGYEVIEKNETLVPGQSGGCLAPTIPSKVERVMLISCKAK